MSAHLIKYTPLLLPPFLSLPPLPLLIIHSPSSICPLYPKAGFGFYVCSSYHSSFGIHPIHYSPASSIVFSCVVMGISISLLVTESSSMYPYMNGPGNSASKWRQPPDPDPNPHPMPRDRGPYLADSDEFQASEILAIVSSALNWLVATAL